MAIDKISILNVMAFQRNGNAFDFVGNPTSSMDKGVVISDIFSMEFCKGINVLIGANGLGKTTILKLLYAASEWSNKKIDSQKAKNILDYFSHRKNVNDSVKNNDNFGDYSAFTVYSGNSRLEFSNSHNGLLSTEGRLDEWQNLSIQSVYIPTTEMLSHSKGFLAFNEKYEMPFDQTQVDILVNAQLPKKRKMSEAYLPLINRLGGIIDGEVVYEDDTFYVKKSSGKLIEFSFEAEGFRKFGLLWLLLQNGLLEKGSILFWDEPECNINPELMPELVDALIELQRNGVQIFVATHSYNLARYFDIKSTGAESTSFFNLYKENAIIKYDKSDDYTNLQSSVLRDADQKLFDAVVNQAMGESTNE